MTRGLRDGNADCGKHCNNVWEEANGVPACFDCRQLSGGSWTRAGSSSAQIMASATLRRYILAFRVAELQLCLQELGLSKKGLKGELQSRLFAYFGDHTGVAARGVNPPKEQHRLDTAGCTRSVLT